MEALLPALLNLLSGDHLLFLLLGVTIGLTVGLLPGLGGIAIPSPKPAASVPAGWRD